MGLVGFSALITTAFASMKETTEMLEEENMRGSVDPYIKVGVETAAFDFLLGHDPQYRDLAVIEAPDNKEDVSAYFAIPETPEAVAKRYELVQTACHYADGALPFVKDVERIS